MMTFVRMALSSLISPPPVQSTSRLGDHDSSGLISRECLVILPEVPDPRLITIRRGGTLTDPHHHLLALWAASCAEHVLPLFESVRPGDPRPRQAIEYARAWVCGEMKMMQARAAGGHAMGAARDLCGAARHAAYSAGQAAAVAHVPAHELGAAAYAIKAARAAAPGVQGEAAGRLECQWQRDRLPSEIRELVLDDQRLRNDICWSVFETGAENSGVYGPAGPLRSRAMTAEELVPVVPLADADVSRPE
jgi:hypothetical protein